MRDRRWRGALAEHDAAVRTLLDTVAGAPRWSEDPAPEKWSTAAVVLHVVQAYDLARDSAGGGPGMRLRVSPLRSRLLRAIVLRIILLVDRFPRDVMAPREVRPDLADARTISRNDAEARLQRAAREAALALRDASPDVTVRHAYFGDLTPYQALRMLSAHTRHHARLLRRAAPRA